MNAADTKLILVKHARPEIVPGKPPSSWLLSREGRASCPPLAALLSQHQPEIIVTSTEPKANETGLLVAEPLGIPFEVAGGLHETLRETTPYVDNTEEWHATLTEFFDRPDELVLGEESATDATHRFSTAMSTVLTEHPDQTVVVVCHGTVISLFVAQVTGAEPFPLWKSLGLPSFVVLSRPDFEILDVVEKVS